MGGLDLLPPVRSAGVPARPPRCRPRPPADSSPRSARWWTCSPAIAAPDGRLPILHDGPYDRVAVHREVLEICVLAGQLWASATGLATVERWARARLGRTHDGLEDLLGGWFPARRRPTAKTARVARALRRGRVRSPAGPRRHVQAVLDAGPHGGSHGHLDKLGRLPVRGAIAWQPAPGVPPYASPLRRGYYARTIAHPTIRVDGCRPDPRDRDDRALGSGGRVCRAVASTRCRTARRPTLVAGRTATRRRRRCRSRDGLTDLPGVPTRGRAPRPTAHGGGRPLAAPTDHSCSASSRDRPRLARGGSRSRPLGRPDRAAAVGDWTARQGASSWSRSTLRSGPRPRLRLRSDAGAAPSRALRRPTRPTRYT